MSKAGFDRQATIHDISKGLVKTRRGRPLSKGGNNRFFLPSDDGVSGKTTKIESVSEVFREKLLAIDGGSKFSTMIISLIRYHKNRRDNTYLRIESLSESRGHINIPAEVVSAVNEVLGTVNGSSLIKYVMIDGFQRITIDVNPERVILRREISTPAWSVVSELMRQCEVEIRRDKLVILRRAMMIFVLKAKKRTP